MLAAALAAASVSVAGAPPPVPSARVYAASLAYARCMRAHGVPQPNPDRNGDIHLTPAGEAAMRRVGRTMVHAADKLCFDLHLKGVVSTKPLSAFAVAQAKVVLRDLAGCMKTFGYVEGRPVVRNLSRGRAFFGFDSPARGGPTGAPLLRAEHTCEQRVHMDKRIDAIVKADRGPY